MLREQGRLLVQLHRLQDLALTVGAFIGSYFVKKYLLPETLGGLATSPNYYIVLLLVIIIWYATFYSFDIYNSFRRQSRDKIIMDVFKAVGVSFLILTMCMYLFKIVNVSRMMLMIFVFLDLFFLIASKMTVYHILEKIRKNGYNYRSVVVIGRKNRARDVLSAIRKRHGSGYHVIGCLDTDVDTVGQIVLGGIRVIDTVTNLENVLCTTVVDELVFAMPMKLIDHADRYVSLAEDMGVKVRIIPDWQLHSLMYEPDIAVVHFENFLGIPTMALHMTTPNMGALLFKYAIDYVFSGLLLIVLLPFFLITAAATKLSSRGPVFFTQDRVGMNGRRFKLYKFRTMVDNADQMLSKLKSMNESDGPVFKIRKDPRIIPYIGTFLRKTSLDELPQLINVLKGEMSMIGPRPPIPEEVRKYEVWQRRRLSIKPGLTCTWQVAPRRNDISFDGWMKMDLEYIDNWSVWTDFKLLLLTMKAVLLGNGR